MHKRKTFCALCLLVLLFIPININKANISFSYIGKGDRTPLFASIKPNMPKSVGIKDVYNLKEQDHIMLEGIVVYTRQNYYGLYDTVIYDRESYMFIKSHFNKVKVNDLIRVDGYVHIVDGRVEVSSIYNMCDATIIKENEWVTEDIDTTRLKNLEGIDDSLSNIYKKIDVESVLKKTRKGYILKDQTTDDFVEIEEQDGSVLYKYVDKDVVARCILYEKDEVWHVLIDSIKEINNVYTSDEALELVRYEIKKLNNVCVEKEIALPKRIENVNIEWKSEKEMLITNEGNVLQIPEIDTGVAFTASFKNGTKTEKINITINILGEKQENASVKVITTKNIKENIGLINVVCNDSLIIFDDFLQNKSKLVLKEKVKSVKIVLSEECNVNDIELVLDDLVVSPTCVISGELIFHIQEDYDTLYIMKRDLSTHLFIKEIVLYY